MNQMMVNLANYGINTLPCHTCGLLLWEGSDGSYTHVLPQPDDLAHVATPAIGCTCDNCGEPTFLMGGFQHVGRCFHLSNRNTECPNSQDPEVPFEIEDDEEDSSLPDFIKKGDIWTKGDAVAEIKDRQGPSVVILFTGGSEEARDEFPFGWTKYVPEPEPITEPITTEMVSPETSIGRMVEGREITGLLMNPGNETKIEGVWSEDEDGTKHLVSLLPNGTVAVDVEQEFDESVLDEMISRLSRRGVTALRAKLSARLRSETEDVNYIDPKEFRELGFLQEVNRLFFHPHGLAMEVLTDKDGSTIDFGGVWDYRHDPEGVVYRPDQIDAEKAQMVLDESKRHAAARKSLLGSEVQPV